MSEKLGRKMSFSIMPSLSASVPLGLDELGSRPKDEPLVKRALKHIERIKWQRRAPQSPGQPFRGSC